MENNKPVLAMYDVRGIQNYIFRTSKLKDAIGASALVEDIIEDALKDSAAKAGVADTDVDLKWCDENGPLIYSGNDKRVQVLYIGGGNAYVTFESRALAVEISQYMARYTLDHTYSLQLATAIVDKTENYKEDYDNLNGEMVRVKDQMMVSKPLDALPIMETEAKTGFPITQIEAYKDNTLRLSTESSLKRTAGKEKRNQDGTNEQERILDSYITKKGLDSMIAVVHIDGNNMGNRIKNIVGSITNYKDAVTRMREISYNINYGYTSVFTDMENHFNNVVSKSAALSEKENKDCFVMKVLTAGDDITYVCNAAIAISTVEFFVNHITKRGMVNDDPDNIYKFSVCGGIAFMNSHFPFNVGYEVAETCCGSAKDCAKENKNLIDGKVGNWFDYQICRNIQTIDLKKTRKREYITSMGEVLYKRPYLIGTDEQNIPESLNDSCKTLVSFKEEMRYVLGNGNNEENTTKSIRRSFAKQLRNSYPLGENTVNQLISFLKSRVDNMPDDIYLTDANGVKTAKYYDALELMDCFTDVIEI